MLAKSLGIIVEGPYDEAILAELIRRIISPDSPVIPRVCFGKETLAKDVFTFLGDLQTRMQGRAVDKALVIRDSGGKDSEEIRAQLTAKIGTRNWRFPHGVQVCIVRREIETWLLADVAAVNAVARERGGREVAEVQGTLEDIEHPKQKLKRLLLDAKLEYTQKVCSEIARSLRLEALRYRCPSFSVFEQQVVDC